MEGFEALEVLLRWNDGLSEGDHTKYTSRKSDTINSAKFTRTSSPSRRKFASQNTSFQQPSNPPEEIKGKTIGDNGELMQSEVQNMCVYIVDDYFAADNNQMLSRNEQFSRQRDQIENVLFTQCGSDNQQDSDYMDETVQHWEDLSISAQNLETPIGNNNCLGDTEFHDDRTALLPGSPKDIHGPEFHESSQDIPTSGTDSKIVLMESNLPKIVSYICQEIISTESDYVRDLTNLLENFLRPINANHVLHKYSSLNTLSSACESILRVHSELLDSINASISEPGTLNRKSLGHLILCYENALHHFEAYSAYCNSFQMATADLQLVRKTNESIKKYILNLDIRAKVQGVSFQSSIIKPVQRLCKYPLLFKKLAQNLTTHTSKDKASQLIQQMERVSSDINDNVKLDQNSRVLLSLRDRTCGKFPELLSPSRTLLFDTKASFTKLSGVINSKKKEVLVYLFSDILFIGKTQPFSGGLSIQKRFHLSNIVVKTPSKTCGLDDNLSIEILNLKKDTLRKHGICKRYIITCSKPIDKQNLLSSITNAILNIIKADRNPIRKQRSDKSEEYSLLQCTSNNYWSDLLQEVQEGKKELVITTKNNISTVTGVRNSTID